MNAIYTQATDTGNISETFFLNQVSVLNNVSLPNRGDFMVNNKYVFEIGGKNKTIKQIIGLDNAFIVKDDIENGHGKVIPLWLFGFLY